LVLAVATLVSALRALLVRIGPLAARFDLGRVAALAGVPLALAYADFAGGSGSAWRAAWMLAVGFTARALGRHPQAFRSLSACFLVGAALDPLLVFDVSFLLSAGATAGLVVLGPRLTRPCRRLPTRPLRWLAASFATTASAMLPCAPLLALMSPEITLIGAAANVIAGPLGELCALPLCLVHPLTSVWPSLERGAALAASGALLGVQGVARAAASARWAMIAVPPPTSSELGVLVVTLVALGVARRRARAAIAGLIVLVAVEAWTVRAERQTGKLVVHVLDVGQGDSILVDLPDGKLMLIDGGGFVGSPVDPGKSVLAPLLRARRRDRIDIAVLTHPHPDHFTGLASALSSVEVGEFWDTGQGEREGAGPTYAALIAGLRGRGVPIRRPPELCGREHRFGELRLRVLGPCPDFTPERNGNDNSFVLRLELGAHAALLSGDAEREEELEILAREGPHLSATFLKAGHHGSRTSTSEPLLDAVRPVFAALSCGVRNRFGHPHAQTLERLGEHGIHILRTDLTGSIRFETDGRYARVDVARWFPD
jgi:competence protein ComEC